jgi:hypothetical protein
LLAKVQEADSETAQLKCVNDALAHLKVNSMDAVCVFAAYFGILAGKKETFDSTCSVSV